MSCLFNSLPDGCVKFEKCGDVIVSSKDNMIGLFCHFCSDIFTNLSEFLHHLQWMHNDVLKFTKAHNVYSIEELLSDDVHSRANSSSSNSSDSGIPADIADAIDTECLNNGISCSIETDAIESIAINDNISSALATYEVDYQETKASKKTNSPKNVLQWQAESLPVVNGKAIDIISEVEAMLLDSEPQAEGSSAPKKAKLEADDASVHNTQLQEMLQAAGLVDFELTKHNSVDLREKPTKLIKDHKSKRGRPQMETKRHKLEKPKMTCDYKSYAIASSARKREQHQRFQKIKKRIYNSLKSDLPSTKRVPFKPANVDNIIENHLILKAHNLAKLKEAIIKDQLVKMEQQKQLLSTQLNFQLETNSTLPAKPSISKLKSDEESFSYPNEIDGQELKKNLAVETQSTTVKTKLKSHEQKETPAVIINKVEVLPELNINQICPQLKLEKSILSSSLSQSSSIDRPPQRRASMNEDSNEPRLKKLPARRPSYPDTSSHKSQHLAVSKEQYKLDNTVNKNRDSSAKCNKTEQNSFNRISLNFDLSESVIEFLQSELKTSSVNADSLLALAEPNDAHCSTNSSETIPNAITSEQQQVPKLLSTQTQKAAAQIVINSEAKELRNDLTLLRAVGLSIIKYSNCEEVKPIKFIDTIRERAAKFANLLRQYASIWNSKRLHTQFTHKILKELQLLTEVTNAEFKMNFKVSEVKRIINLVNAWHAQQIDLKFFKKVRLSSSIDHYLQLFAFLPKINHCVYYCEWCDESCSNKSRYEKHRLTHLSLFACPQCNKGFKKQGYLLNHMRTVHSQDH